MLNFTVGPVMSSDLVHNIAKEDVPYFRTSEFSKIVLECESLTKKFLNARESARVIFLTGSGTAAMDAAISNTLSEQDNVLIINGGAFGHRFVEICEAYKIPHVSIDVEFGKNITKKLLEPYNKKGYTALLVQSDETSSGVRMDLELLSNFCKENNLFFIVDSISSFLCDPFDMVELGVNIVLTGSQKALALHPGLSLLCVDEIAIDKINNSITNNYYLDLKKYLINGERGQTPFTPCVGIINQLHARLKEIEKNGGVNSEINRTKELASYFREEIKKYPFECFVKDKSNAVTALKPLNENVSCKQIFEVLKNEYGIFVCPSGGGLADKIFRVGHIGNIKKEDYDKLFSAFDELINRKIIIR